MLCCIYSLFDVIGEITFAKRFGFLDKGEDINGLMKGIEAYLSYGAKVGMIPELHYPIMRILEFINRGKLGGPLGPMMQVARTRSCLDDTVYQGSVGRQKRNRGYRSAPYKVCCLVLIGPL